LRAKPRNPKSSRLTSLAFGSLRASLAAYADPQSGTSSAGPAWHSLRRGVLSRCVARDLFYCACPCNEPRCEVMAAKSKAKRAPAKAAKPAVKRVSAKAPAARKIAAPKARAPEISSDLRKVALAHVLRRLH
jgi:hypothetical protein